MDEPTDKKAFSRDRRARQLLRFIAYLTEHDPENKNLGIVSQDDLDAARIIARSGLPLDDELEFPTNWLNLERSFPSFLKSHFRQWEVKGLKDLFPEDEELASINNKGEADPEVKTALGELSTGNAAKAVTAPNAVAIHSPSPSPSSSPSPSPISSAPPAELKALTKNGQQWQSTPSNIRLSSASSTTTEPGSIQGAPAAAHHHRTPSTDRNREEPMGRAQQPWLADWFYKPLVSGAAIPAVFQQVTSKPAVQEQRQPAAANSQWYTHRPHDANSITPAGTITNRQQVVSRPAAKVVARQRLGQPPAAETRSSLRRVHDPNSTIPNTISSGPGHSVFNSISSPLDSALTLPRRDTTATSSARHASASQPEHNDGLGYRSPLQGDLNTTAAGGEAPAARDAVPREYYAWVLAQRALSKARKSLKQAETAERDAENAWRRWQRTNKSQTT